MTRFVATTLDLSTLPPPDAISRLDYEALLAERKITLIECYDARGITYDVAALESDPSIVLQEADAYRELLCRGEINDCVRAVMLAFSQGRDLDHLGRAFGIARRVVTPATDKTPAVYESDSELRRRIQIAPEAYNTCGSAASYIHHALDVAPELVDAAPILYQTTVGNPAVRVICLARDGDGVPAETTLARVRARLNARNVKPMTVPVAVAGVQPVPYTVAARLFVPPGPDTQIIRTAALAAARKVVAQRRGLGIDVLREAFAAAVRVANVERVQLNAPADDIPIAADQVGHCTSVTVAVTVLDDE